MPQMSPMLWLIMLLMFNLMLLIKIMNLYSIKEYSFNSKLKKMKKKYYLLWW